MPESNLFLDFIDFLLLNYKQYFSIVLFLILLCFKLIVYSIAKADPRDTLERTRIEFCSIGFAFLTKALFDKDSQLYSRYGSGVTLAGVIFFVTSIFFLIFLVAVGEFIRYKEQQKYLLQQKDWLHRYRHLIITYPCGVFLVFCGINLV